MYVCVFVGFFFVVVNNPFLFYFPAACYLADRSNLMKKPKDKSDAAQEKGLLSY